MGKQHKSRPWLIGGVSGVLIAAVALFYHTFYPVEPDGSNLETCIKDFYNRGFSIEQSPVIQIHDSVTLGKTKYVLIELGEDLGRVILSQGLTGRYRIEKLGYGGGNFREGIVENAGKKYLLYGGRNTALQIAAMSVTLDGFTYNLAIPAKTRFLVCTEIDSRIEDNHVDLNRVVVYNAQGEDITERVDLSGGGM